MGLPGAVRRPARPSRLRTLAVAVLATAAVVAGAGPAGAAQTPPPNPVTPGDFTGYGFDQCLAPTQAKMDTWWLTSPFTVVGVYISGDSRACASQPNLTATWVRTQLATGWRILPITVGPQAACNTRYKRNQISASTASSYARARAQGKAEADKTVLAAQRLGIAARSTLWYDLEAYDISRTTCRVSALTFLDAWTDQLHARGFRSGVYSSAASGIRALDDARVKSPSTYTMPDQVWIADWNGKANTSSSYVRSDGWTPRNRVHQYLGGHNVTYGGVTINIDSNFVDVGKGSVVSPEGSHCGNVSVNYPTYYTLKATTTGHADQVMGLQCMLKHRKLYDGPIDGKYGAATIKAVRAYRAARGFAASDTWSRAAWVALLSESTKTPVLKFGSASDSVRRLQRALNAAGTAKLSVTGVLTQPTVDAVKAYQKALGVPQYGVVTPATWKTLRAGRY